MKKAFLMLAAAFAVSAVYAQQTEVKQRDYIEVRGYAKRMVEPNKAEITIVLNQADSKGKFSIQELESQLAAALTSTGVDAQKQLELVEQNSEAYKTKKAYQYKKFVLTVSSSIEAQNVFTALADNGVRNAEISRIWNDKQDQIERELRVEAMVNAQDIAKSLAKAVDQNIGGAIMIIDNSYPSNYGDNLNLRRSESYKFADVQALPQVDFQKITIEHGVTVRFLLR